MRDQDSTVRVLAVGECLIIAHDKNVGVLRSGSAASGQDAENHWSHMMHEIRGQYKIKGGRSCQ